MLLRGSGPSRRGRGAQRRWCASATTRAPPGRSRSSWTPSWIGRRPATSCAARIFRLLDGTLLLAADWNKTESIAGPSERWYAHRGLPWNWTFDPDSGPLSEAWLYRSLDHGRTWSGPERTGCLTTSLNLKQIGDGTLFLSGGHFRTAGEYEAQVLYRSEDAGRTWSAAITVVDDRRLLCSEGDLVEMPDGTLVLYIRCDNNPARTGIKTLSSDGGRSWDGPYAAGYWPIIGRVNAGLLSSGEVLVVHRMGGFAPQHWFGYFIEDRETALARPPNLAAARRIPPATVWGTDRQRHQPARRPRLRRLGGVARR